MGDNRLASVHKMPLNGARLLGGVPQKRELKLRITAEQAKNLMKMAGMYGWDSPTALAEKMLANAIDSAASVEIMRHALGVVANHWTRATFA